MGVPSIGQKWGRSGASRDLLALLLFTAICVLYFSPVLFFGKSLLLYQMDEANLYARMAERASWLRAGIVPLWDPKTFTGVSYIDRVPPAQLLNLQPWVMSVAGNRLGFHLCILALFVLGAQGAYLLCLKRFFIRWKLAVACGVSVAFAPSFDMAALFTLYPFIAFFLYFFLPVFEESRLNRIVKNALWSVVPLALCFYTQETRMMEFIFWSGLIVFIAGTCANSGSRVRSLRNGIVFFTVASIFFIPISLPALHPVVTEVFHQVRLGAGKTPPGLIPFPPGMYVLDILAGAFFPVNLSITQDNVNVRLLGSFFTLYPNYVHLFFYSSIALGLSVVRKLKKPEKTWLFSLLALAAVIVFLPIVPGFLRAWTLIFKTGRFIQQDVLFFFGAVFSFVMMDKILFRPEEFGFPKKWLKASAFVAATQKSIAAVALTGLAAGFFLVRSVAGPLHINEKLVYLFYDRFAALLLAMGAVFCLAWLLERFLRSLAGGARALDSGKINAFILVSIAAPLCLTAAYWPFNRLPDRFMTRTPEKRFLASLDALDRTESVWFHPQLRKKSENSGVISYNEHRSLRFVTRLHRAASASFLVHFLPVHINDYFNAVYENDENFSKLIPGYNKCYFYPHDDNLFHLLGVRYFFSELDVFEYPFVKIRKFPDYYVYQNEKALPRYYFAETVRPADRNWTDEDVLDAIRDAPYETLRRTAIVTDGRGGGAVENFRPENGSLNLVRHGPNEIEFRTDAAEPEFLILNDTFDERWKAFVDGREFPVYRVNHLFRGVRLPPGEHVVLFKYVYPEFFVCLWIAGASCLALASLIAFSPSGGRPRS